MLYANTDDGSSALWVLDDDGVVIDNISIYGAERAPILAQINEHYGTSFTGWSDNEIGLRFGDPLPNWNAYEKILLDILNVKFNSGFFGQKVGDKLYIATSNGSNQIIVDVQGGFVGSLEGPVLDETAKTQYFYRMRSAGFEIQETLAETLSLQVGDYVEGWSEMTLVN